MSTNNQQKKDELQKTQKVRADESTGDDAKFDHTKDKSFKSLSFQIGAFIAIVFVSGKLVGYLVDNYMFEGASKGLPESAHASKLEMLKGASMGRHLGISNTFLSEDQIADQYDNLKVLTEDNLKSRTFFGKKRNFFIQVANEKEEMHGHFYHLKNISRKKSQPLYVYRLNPQDIKDTESLKKQFHIDSLEELKETGYILINEDGLRLP